MSWVRKVSFALLVAVGAYVLTMGVWSTSLKYLSLSNHHVQKSWDTLEQFAPSDVVAYTLVAMTMAAILALNLTKPRPGSTPGPLQQ